MLYKRCKRYLNIDKTSSGKKFILCVCVKHRLLAVSWGAKHLGGLERAIWEDDGDDYDGDDGGSGDDDDRDDELSGNF